MRFWKLILPVGFVVISFFCTEASADIFRYTDANGTVHFVDRHAGSRYKLYKKTKRFQKSRPIKSVPKYTRYESIIKRASLKHGVEVKLIKSVIEVESGFNPTAVSKAGATGLMQLMPETAKMYGVKNRFSPTQNINGGTKYLKHLLKRYNGNLQLVLAAYNAGEDAVAKYSGIPPYEETENYVEIVTALYYDRKPKLIKKRKRTKQKIYRYVGVNGVLLVTDTPLTSQFGN